MKYLESLPCNALSDTCDLNYLHRQIRSLAGRLAIAYSNDRIFDTESIVALHNMMSAQATLPSINIEQTLKQILASKEITPNEQRWLISLCFGGSLSLQQEYLVNQVYEALRNRLLVVVSEACS